ncbi:MAG: patatin-like phospholipase family protein [Brumimicrobium sp.]|nr:patatin-like phospholipase family protein [Brumimicrobium sp.]MCO5269848.1 patatin-like phospholipase family protein [Brumimicrobium sp.]
MTKKIRILCLDGGGIRGIIPATVMEYVEHELKKRTNNQQARIADYFDMIVGTSTGGILACYYLFPNPKKDDLNEPTSLYEASEALDLYAKLGPKIFTESKRFGWFGLRQLFNATMFSSSNIETIFKEEFGDVYMDDLVKKCVITTYNMDKQRSFFFDSRDEKKGRKFLIRDVARSTSAAPTYFPSAIIKNYGDDTKMVNIDGGVFANNPAMCAYAEARNTNFQDIGKENFPSAKDMLILSIGTGAQNLNLNNYQQSNKWGIIKWAKAIPDIMMDGSADTVNYQAKLLFETLEGEDKKNYKRVDVPSANRNENMYSTDMSDASQENIENLKRAGKLALEQAQVEKKNEFTLDEFIDQLINHG